MILSLHCFCVWYFGECLGVAHGYIRICDMLCGLWTGGRHVPGLRERGPLQQAPPGRRNGPHHQGIYIQVGVKVNGLLVVLLIGPAA